MAYRVNLTRKQEQRLRQLVHDNKDNPHILKRLYCVLLRHEGQSNENITKLLDIHEDTIADWLRIYVSRGLPGLLNFRYHKRRKSRLNKYRARIMRIAGKKSVKTVEQLQQEIREKLGVEVEYSWLYRFARKNGIYSKLRGSA
jgi:transposase